MAEFWEIIKNVIFRAFLTLFWANENLPEKSGHVTFECLWSPNFIHKKNQKKLPYCADYKSSFSYRKMTFKKHSRLIFGIIFLLIMKTFYKVVN